MPLHAADLVFEYLVVEAGFEFALPGRGGGDVHGGLAAAEDHEGFLGGDGGGVEGGVGGVGFQRGEVAGGDELEVGVSSERGEKQGIRRGRTLAVLSLEAVMK